MPSASSAARLLSPSGPKLPQQMFTQVGGQPLDSATDGRLMHMQRPGNLQQGLTIEKVGREQEAVLRLESVQSLLDRFGEMLHFGRCRLRFLNSHGRIQRVERSLAPRAAMVIDMPLRKRGAKPAKKRASARVGRQRRPALLSFSRPKAIKLGIERVGKFMSQRGRSRHSGRRLVERCAIKIHKALPRHLATQRACCRERKISKPKTPQEAGSLSRTCRSRWRLTEVELLSKGRQRGTELFDCQVAGLSPRCRPQLTRQIFRDHRSRTHTRVRRILRTPCGTQGQDEMTGLWRGRVHASEDTAFTGSRRVEAGRLQSNC